MSVTNSVAGWPFMVVLLIGTCEGSTDESLTTVQARVTHCQAERVIACARSRRYLSPSTTLLSASGDGFSCRLRCPTSAVVLVVRPRRRPACLILLILASCPDWVIPALQEWSPVDCSASDLLVTRLPGLPGLPGFQGFQGFQPEGV